MVGHTDEQVEKQMDRKMDRLTDKPIERLKDKRTKGYIYRRTNQNQSA